MAKSGKYEKGRKYNIFDENAMEGFLDTLEETGLYVAAADAVGCAVNETANYRRDNPDFQELCDIALERYRERIIREAHRRAVEGHEEPIFGGKFRDEKVGTKRVFSDRLMELFLKRGKDGTFRDRAEVEVKGGVDLKSEMDLSTLSTRAREKLRELLDIITEDDVNRAMGKEVK